MKADNKANSKASIASSSEYMPDDMPVESAELDEFDAASDGKNKALGAFLKDESGTTTLEWLLLLGAIALPSVYIFTVCLATIVDYYRMMTTLNSLPFP